MAELSDEMYELDAALDLARAEFDHAVHQWQQARKTYRQKCVDLDADLDADLAADRSRVREAIWLTRAKAFTLVSLQAAMARAAARQTK